MIKPSKSSKARLKLVLVVVIFLVVLLIGRLGYLQIYKSEELKKGALEQWTKAIDIKSKRGIIYDRKGKKLAISISASTIWAYPKEIKDPLTTAKTVAGILDLDEEVLYEKLTSKRNTERIKQWVSREEANELRDLDIVGISVVDDNKRYYPYGNFATNILGFWVNPDNISPMPKSMEPIVAINLGPFLSCKEPNITIDNTRNIEYAVYGSEACLLVQPQSLIKALLMALQVYNIPFKIFIPIAASSTIFAFLVFLSPIFFS